MIGGMTRAAETAAHTQHHCTKRTTRTAVRGAALTRKRGCSGIMTMADVPTSDWPWPRVGSQPKTELRGVAER